MKYRTVQTMMLPDCAEENYGLYYQGTGGIQVQQGEKNHYPYRKMRKQICLRILTGFTETVVAVCTAGRIADKSYSFRKLPGVAVPYRWKQNGCG